MLNPNTDEKVTYLPLIRYFVHTLTSKILFSIRKFHFIPLLIFFLFFSFSFLFFSFSFSFSFLFFLHKSLWFLPTPHFGLVLCSFAEPLPSFALQQRLQTMSAICLSFREQFFGTATAPATFWLVHFLLNEPAGSLDLGS